MEPATSTGGKAKRDLAATSSVCPKCDQVYLFIKDWGRTGALFVHGYATDEASRLRHKVACQVPVALGRVTMEACI